MIKISFYCILSISNENWCSMKGIELCRRLKVYLLFFELLQQVQFTFLCVYLNKLIHTLQLIGVTCLALGVYLCVKDPRSILEWADVLLNPAVMLTIIGLAVCIVSLLGSLGALRDSITLLKTVHFFSFRSLQLSFLLTNKGLNLLCRR